jgi:Uncharacterized alpha/beta hydrolase domain (DUF2235)
MRPRGAANRTHGRLRRLARIALWVISGFIIGSILLVALYRYLPPPGTRLILRAAWRLTGSAKAGFPSTTSPRTWFVPWHSIRWGGIFGAGLGENIRRAYRILSFHYEPGDEVFVFGFSRGAY